MLNDDLSPELQSTLDTITESFRKHFRETQATRSRQRADKNRHGLVRFSRAIMEMGTDRGLQDGPEREFFTEVAKFRGQQFDAHRITLPLRFLDEQRDLTVAQASAGGYLVGVDVGEAKDVLRPWSISIQGGVTVEENLTGNVVIPKTGTGTDALSWQGSEQAQAPPTQPTVSQIAMTPKVGVGIVNASRNFMIQANPERWLRRELKRVAGVAVDTAALVGSGNSGQPLGLLNYLGLSTQSGTSLAWAGVLAMKKNASLANVPHGTTKFISNPTTMALLEGRERATGNGGFIWQDDKIASCAAFATTLMPASTMISGPFTGLTLGLWSDLQIEINPSDPALFKTGAVQIRVLVAVDTCLTIDPLAFTVASSIT